MGSIVFPLDSPSIALPQLAPHQEMRPNNSPTQAILSKVRHLGQRLGQLTPRELPRVPQCCRCLPAQLQPLASRIGICASRVFCFIPNMIRTLASRVTGSVVGYILRICIFQLGDHHSCLKRFFMRIYRHLASEPSPGAVDLKRLSQAKQQFLSFGGVEAFATPADEHAPVHLMMFTSAKFFQKVSELGGERVQRQDGTWVIRPKPGTPPKKFVDLCKMLKKLGPDKDCTEIPLPPSPAGQAPMVVHFHSPGRSMLMDSDWIYKHLAAGYDICCSDLRGTLDPKGFASEGGYYLDAQAVLDHVVGQGYPLDRIWVSGYCEGAAVASHLFAHNRVNFVAQNPFYSATELVQGFTWLGRYLGPFGIPAIQSTDPAVTKLVKQDGFSFDKCKGDHQGQKAFIIHTSTDRTVPSNTQDKIAEVMKNNSSTFIPCIHTPSNRKANGHTPVPTQYPLVWTHYVTIVN